MSHDKGAIKWAFVSGLGLSLMAKLGRLGLPTIRPTASAISRRFGRGKRPSRSATKPASKLAKAVTLPRVFRSPLPKPPPSGSRPSSLGAVTIRRRKQSTLRQYRSHLKHHILPGIGKVKLSQLTRANVSAFRDHLLTKLSRVMAKKVLTSFKGIIGEAEARGYVIGNVASSVKIGNKGRHKEPVAIPSKAEVKSHNGKAR